jgi:hypothetical protein
MHKLLIWHNNDKGAVKKVMRALSANPQLKAAHEWFSTASVTGGSANVAVTDQ